MRNFWLNDTQTVSSVRIGALQGLIFFLLLAIVGRLFYLQIIQKDYFAELGSRQRAVDKEIKAERGEIYALADLEGKNLYPLAINNIFYDISADPKVISRPQNIVDALAKVLAWDETAKAQALEKLKKTDRRYEMIAKEVPRRQAEDLQKELEIIRQDINKEQSKDKQIINLSQLGINFEKHTLRYYPDKSDGAQMLGFYGYDKDGSNRVGSYGLEAYFEKDLAGQVGVLKGEKDVQGRLVNQEDKKLETNGADLILTIDKNIQYRACQALAKAVPEYKAESGTVIVMDPASGAIRAMCNYPSFDPNKYSEVEDTAVYNNNAVYQNYEPGSVMKVIAMAIAIDQGKVTPTTNYEDQGEVKFSSGQVIRNADLKAHGWIDMKEVIAASLNTGIVFATADVSNSIFKDYMENFGFGKATGISISQENIGDISLLAKKGDIYKATASYGQGITVTPLQMLAAVNTIANRGVLMKPYIVKQINYADGREEKFAPQAVRKVLEPSTASQLTAMMVNAVENGHSAQAQVKGYYVAGKTGTAQVADPNTGKYDSSKTIQSFVGFAPSENPKFIIITKLDNPAARFAESTAVPLFGEIAKYLLEYYQVPPSR